MNNRSMCLLAFLLTAATHAEAQSIASLSPNTAVAGSPATTLLINGQFPVGTAGPVVNWTFQGSTTSLQVGNSNSSQISATIPASLLAVAGTAAVQVIDGSVSNVVDFTITTAPLTLSQISPTSALAGGPSFTLFVDGSGFTTSTSIIWNGSPLTTAFVSSSGLTATVPATLIATPGTASITVEAPGETSPEPFTFAIVAPLVLSSISPNSAVAGGPAFTLSVNGSGFSKASKVIWSGTTLATSFLTATQLIAAVPANLIATAGTASVDVVDGTQTSSPLAFTINPPFMLTSLSPSSAAAGGPSFTLTVNGTGFDSSTAIFWNSTALATVSLSASQISVTVPASLIAQAGTASIDAVKSSTQVSNILTFTITAPTLTITSLSPSSAVAGGPSFTLTVNGAGFDSSTTIFWNSRALATVSLSASQISVTVPASLIAQSGTASIDAVKSSTQVSNSLTFTITPPPLTLTSISPPSAIAGGPAFTLTASGSGFTSATQVTWNGSPLATSLASATQLTAAVPATLIATAGSEAVGVAAPNQTSPAPLTFVITPALTLTSLSPSSGVAGGPSFTLTVNGTAFDSSTSIFWNGTALSTVSTSATQMSVTVPASLIAQPGTASINAKNSTQVSNALTFTITPPPLTLTSISPSSAVASGPAFTITVNGTGFAGATIVTWNGSPLSTNFVATTQLTASVPASLIANAGTALVGVSSPNQISPSPLAFIINPVLTLTSVSPSSATPGGPAFVLTVNGTGFAPGTIVLWNNLALSTTVTNTTLMSATVPANLIAQPGIASITAQNGSLVSNALTFSITGQPIILSSLSPSSAPAGSPAFTLTVNGSGFLPPSTASSVLIAGTTVTWNGTALTTQFLSSNQLTASVPAALLTNPGTASVSVTGQPQPASLPFIITASLTLTSISPSTVPSGGPGFTLTVNGSGFTASTSVTLNGSLLATTFVSTTQLTAAVPAAFIATPGAAAISVSATNQQPPAPLQLTITQGLNITSLSPSSATAGGPAFTLTVNGNGFTASATINWNSAPLSTTFVSTTQLTATVNANLIAQPGSASITASNGSLISNTLTFNIVAPTPVITSLSPSTAISGGPAFTLTINGTGFLPTSTVSWNGTSLSATFLSATQLTAAVTASLIAQTGTAGVVVSNGTVHSNSATFTITSPAPVITSISPATITAGGPTFTLTVNGTGFVANAAVSFNNTPLVTTFVSGTQVTAGVPAAMIAQPGSAQITLSNPSGPASNTVTLTITAPAPVITSISPATVTAGGPTFTLTVNGTGFVANAAVSFNNTPLATTFVSGTQVTAGVPAAMIAQPGSAQITLSNPSGPASNAVTLTITAPTPTITSISPATVAAGGPAFTLTVTGTSFLSGATVSLGSAALTTAFVSATQLTAAVPATLIAQAGIVQITAVNAGGTPSNALTLTITAPTPTITSISPVSVAAGGPAFTLTVTGTSFLSGATVSLGSAALTTTFVSATQLTAAVPATLIAQAGTVQITAVNAGGTPSNPVSLSVTAPAISSISPASIPAGGPAFTLTVTGTNFVSAATVSAGNTALTTTFVSATQLTAAVPATLTAQPGTLPITVANGGGTPSNPVTLTITASVPAISVISPATVTQGGPAFTLSVVGNSFLSGATVFLGSTALTTTFGSSTQLSAAVPANLIQQPGTLAVTVTNPGSAASNPLPLIVTPAPPTITSISPATITAGGPSFTLTVNGTNFLMGANVFLNNTQLTTTGVSATQVTAQVPANLIAQPGSAQITAANPGSAQSVAVTLTITPAAPTLTVISPASANVGDPTFNLTLTGTGFVQASVAQWNGAPLSTTFVSNTQLTATIDAGRLILPGTASVTVVNQIPGGSQLVSNALTFTINPVLPIISSISPNSATAGDPALSLTVNGTGFLTLTTIQWNSTALTTHFVNAGQVTADVPATLLAQAGTASVTAINPGNNVSGAVTFTINAPAPPVLTSLSKTSATIGDPAFTLTVNGTGFRAGAVVNFGTNALATTFVSATQLTAAVTANLLLTSTTYQVVVQQAGMSSNALSFTVNLPPPPALRLNPPATAGPAQQPPVDFGLNSGYPVTLTGTVTLTFTSNATIPVDDPSIQFAAGGRTLSFTIAPNVTTLPALVFSTGTVAGAIKLSVTLTAAGVDVTPPNSTATIVVAKAVPVIVAGSVKLIRAAGYLEVDLTGFSTTRDMTQATFHLNAAPNGSFTSTDITVPLSALFTTWYQSAASATFGSQFSYAQPFSVIGDTSQVQSVTVTLTNSIGASVSVTSN